MHTLSLCLGTTRPLSVALQSSDIDAYRAMCSVETCSNTIQSYREDSSFQELFERAESSLGEDRMIETPRIASRMTKRSNPPSSSPFEYFRRTIFLPYVDTVWLQLKERFSNHKKQWKGLFSLLPAVVKQDGMNYETIDQLADFYSETIPGTKLELVAEVKRWVGMINNSEAEDDIPSSVIEALKLCHNLRTYPNLEILLKILATLPVTTCSSERSFSALKHLKSYLRSTMVESRLNGLAALYIHKDIVLNKEAVINEFSKDNRRMKFL